VSKYELYFSHFSSMLAMRPIGYRHLCNTVTP